MPRLPLLLPLLALCLAAVPVTVEHGRLVTSETECIEQLGEPASAWEGPSSQAIVAPEPDGFSLTFRLDISQTPYWICLKMYCHRDGSIDLVGYECDGAGTVIGDVGCEGYESLAKMRTSHEWLAVDGMRELVRAGIVGEI